MRESRDSIDVVGDRLRAVLRDSVPQAPADGRAASPASQGSAVVRTSSENGAAPPVQPQGRPAFPASPGGHAAPEAPAHGHAVSQAQPQAGPFDDTTPLKWSDLIPSWPDDVDLPDEEPATAPANDAKPAPAYPWDPPASRSPSASTPASPGTADQVDVLRASAEAPVPADPVVISGFSGQRESIPQWTYEDGHEDPAGGAGVLGGAGAFGSRDSGGRSNRLSLFDPGRRGVKALAAVALLVVVIAAVLAWRARPRVDPLTVPPVDAQATASLTNQADGSGGAARAAGTPRPSGATEVVVAVGGKVRKPGLVRLAPGARVADALQAAGGAQPGVDVAMLNLARKVVDGELIMVGVTPPPGAPVATGAAGAPAGGGTPAGGPVNLNTATLADLDTLPGVGPVLAQRILDARDAQGGFKSVSDLRKVDGIGDSRYEQLKDLVVV